MTNRIEASIRHAITKGIETVIAYNRRRLPAPRRPHPFLTGMHTPTQEEVTIEDLPVSGTLPSQLDGRYCRIGPNAVAPDPRTHHWFLGDGMIHAVRIGGGRASWYRNRWIRSTEVGIARGIRAAPGPRRGIFDVVNTNVIGHAGATWALMEATSTPVRLDETLDDQSYDDFGGTLEGTFAAHPRRDPETGELHAIAYEARTLDQVRHVVVSAEGKVRRELSVPVKHGPSIHDCALTGRFVVVLDLPVTFSFLTLLAGHRFPYRWNPAHRARVGLLPREGEADDVIWVDIDPCYVFHAANAYDLPDGRVVLDAVAYDRIYARPSQGPDALPRGLERWIIDPAARTVERRTLHDRPQEFPRIDERRTGRPHRYVYTVGLQDTLTPDLHPANHLLKHDLETGRSWRHDFGSGWLPGEFTFVPRPGLDEEDAGWLVGFVLDQAKDSTDLVVLNAQEFDASPVARVHIPHRIPIGFHGNWIPNDEISIEA